MIEFILRFSIERRIFIISLLSLLIMAGLWSYQKLPIDAVPDITNVQVQINTKAIGYSPLESEQRISYPVETALAGLPRLSYTRSISRYGLSQVTAVFDEGTDLYFARNLINERLNSIKNQLPSKLEPEMGPIATGLGEIFSYTVEALPDAKQENGEAFDAMALREIQDWIIKPQLALVAGIVEINTIGGFNKQYHVMPNPRHMISYGISISDIRLALSENNDNQGAGYIEKNGQQLLVRSVGQLKTLEDINNVVVKHINSIPIKISDIAEVGIGKELRTGAATRDGRETVLGTAMMLVGENSRVVSLNVASKLEAIKPSLPKGIKIEAVYDRTNLVDKAIATVQKNLIEGALLVIAILFLLLGNLRAALITAAVIPLAMLATITGMAQTGISANLMSLGALDFGLIVDGAVIIVENAIRRLSEAQRVGSLTKQQRLQLVFEATNEVIRPSLFGVLIITIVYIPLFSLTGVEGKMFHPMAATVVMALLAVLALSLTVVPAAVALFMTAKVSEKENVVIVYLKHAYSKALARAITFRIGVLSAALALFIATGWLSSTLGSEFIPELNEGDIALQAMRIPGTSLQQSIEMQLLLEKTIGEFPQVDKVFSKIGTPEVATDPMPPNIADVIIMLKPRDTWPQPKLTQTELTAQIAAAVRQLPGNNYEFTQPIQMRFNELISGVRSDVGIKIFGDDLDQLLSSANNILAIVNTIEGATDAQVEQISGLPMLTIEPKRTMAARLGFTGADIQDFIATAIGGESTGLIFEGDRRFELAIRLDEDTRSNLNTLSQLPVISPDGNYFPLSEIATIHQSLEPNQISRENGKRRIVVTVNVSNRDLGSFVTELKQRIGSDAVLPPGYWIDYGGTFEQLESASQRLSIVVPATLIVILAMLVIVFGSIKDALIIFTGIPLALTGGIISLWLRDLPLSISAAVGFIALSGVAVLNGLVMLTFIRDLWHKNNDLNKAIIEGAAMRLRPVLMTALVASLGFVPMALNTGTGAEVQRPLATVVIGGIISSTFLTLFVLPILYKMVYSKKA